MPVRWVGFDMDECLGSFMSLWSYVDPLLDKQTPADRDRIIKQIAQRLSAVGSLWLFRPGFDRVLRALVDAKQRGAIHGCFILSNNGSARLVEIVRQILNERAGAHGAPTLFVVGWHRTAPCRGRSLVKSWAVVQRCLASAGLPTMTRHTDLLFYDDLDHQLSAEIPHYVRVPAYFNYTPHALVFKEIQAVLQREGLAAEEIRTAYTRASKNEEADLREDRELIVRPPTPAVENEGVRAFMEGLERFLPKKAKVAPAPKKRQTRKKLRRDGMFGGRRLSTAAA